METERKSILRKFLKFLKSNCSFTKCEVSVIEALVLIKIACILDVYKAPNEKDTTFG